ncbi:GlcG/HbpS family heme-binding protein [Bradyrhizobium vignae]|uniref:Heme-binding protein n=1 Tax=Bradyrhizobium vignae TaxID=1549949 RepID=A0A2U3PUU9_9BRAD|nr:heme-binding protein [Bradyrhizobium vignae]SPP92930.1 putative Protein GlcG [Bradyrhizobium vignae]
MVQKLGLPEARMVVDAMLKSAGEKGFVMSAAVVDFGGDLIHLARMDGASAVTARMSYNKAYTAVKWQKDTKLLRARLFDWSLGDNRREVSWFGDPLFTPIWGGVVLRDKNGTMLGAIGESGASPEQDEEIGQLGKMIFESL